ncbi:hypothetical protein [Thiothrix fructosivorans]|uniref:CBM-cenC domain-containing protein n=1 Tax=Thiothrix fructosivorans TaxID=111770 RepID=A0A8B0SHB4_9GAMM|nr:hypothetical protein [Thiothrix fructosivorans]MBO0614342.1 hypothetical protein [Thiothrix fructosivorans]QTX09187.1 hypothetical protein J1836_011060 [Thiothrix fructosivorans]
MITKWIIGSLILAYGGLLTVTGIADGYGRTYNAVDGGNSDGYNPLFDPGNYHAPTHFPLLFPPNAYLALAEQAAVDGKVDDARRHAFDAVRHNPANGEAALMLLELYARPALYRVVLDETEYDAEDTGTTEPDQATDETDATEAFPTISPADKAVADTVADISYRLRPTYLTTLATVADYWSASKEDAKSFRARSALLVNNPESAEVTFPLFHTALDDPRFTEFFAQHLASPPVWWPAFFNYLLANEPDADKIHRYYMARANSAHPPIPAERDSYVNHLIKSKYWSKAYQVWADNLSIPAGSETQLYDGGFEDTKNINQAFTWKISQPAPTVKVQQTSGMGVTGKLGLHITFKKGTKSVVFQHVSQTRLLPAGDYTLQGRYRLAQLRTSKGLRWRMHCADKPDLPVLGESAAFKGNGVWEKFTANLRVPTGCQAQLLRLETDSPYAHHNVFEGEIWFDDLSIVKGSTPP